VKGKSSRIDRTFEEYMIGVSIYRPAHKPRGKKGSWCVDAAVRLVRSVCMCAKYICRVVLKLDKTFSYAGIEFAIGCLLAMIIDSVHRPERTSVSSSRVCRRRWTGLVLFVEGGEALRRAVRTGSSGGGDSEAMPCSTSASMYLAASSGTGSTVGSSWSDKCQPCTVPRSPSKNRRTHDLRLTKSTRPPEQNAAYRVAVV
jgi:hypothetical protein